MSKPIDFTSIFKSYISKEIQMAETLQKIISGNDLVKRAYEFAKHAHQNEKRKNGEPFINHCLATGEILAEWKLDPETIAAGFLHDVPRSKDETQALEEIKKEFGEAVASLVNGVVQISKIAYRGTQSRVENLRKFILYMSRDIRVILIKFASRLNTLKILYAYPETLQKNIALKTMEIYAPLAYQLGMYRAAGDLEDLAFPYLYKEDYKSLITAVRDRFEEREHYLQKFKPLLHKELEANGVKIISLDSRAKHYFSLYKKLLSYNMDLEKIYDLVAIRVILKEVNDCYTALGVIHKIWAPVPGRIKDYIAAPKPNGYRSLHTTIYGPEDKFAEIQIRTQEMHQEAELGIAAYFAYQSLKGTKKYLAKLISAIPIKELNLIKELRKFPKELSKVGFFKDRILILTPKGEVIDLPTGATTIDFAYKIHSDIGNHAGTAKVNNKIVPLHHELQSGDVVEILTDKKRKPSADWLDFVKTSQAREKIRSNLRNIVPAFMNIESKPHDLEIKLTVAHRLGLIKEINNIFGKAKIKIHTFDLDNQSQNHSIKIVCPTLLNDQLQKLLEQFKEFKGIKKVTYRNI